ncbi:hypothetical protein F4778DRAFT_777719 [Xylariomycetidae sp. FL2044]|nr:hypothetical protein F4778DRAFT_777719 [Xylariomycetidae sp. FL2044]
MDPPPYSPPHASSSSSTTTTTSKGGQSPPPSSSPPENSSTTNTTTTTTIDLLLQPVNLLLAGQTIHAESTSAAPPLYALSRTPTPPPACAFERESSTRRKRARTDGGPEGGATEYDKVLFEVKWSRNKTKTKSNTRSKSKSKKKGDDDDDDGRYEWHDFNGRTVALEDGADGQDRLVVTAALERETVDALVGLWCLRLWHDSAKAKEKETHRSRDAVGTYEISSQ